MPTASPAVIVIETRSMMGGSSTPSLFRPYVKQTSRNWMAPRTAGNGGKSRGASAGMANNRRARRSARLIVWKRVQIPRARCNGCIERPDNIVQATRPPIVRPPSITINAPNPTTTKIVSWENKAPMACAVALRRITCCSCDAQVS